jgi:multidrug efflux pump subunit AcrB
MTPIEIVLIIIGAVILIASFFLTDKSKTNEYAALINERELSLTEVAAIKDKVEAIIAEVTEESLTKTEDQMNQLSNEKIIAVNDFSGQVLEKISQNHEEVVFLYNMLNEKESEIKETIKNIDMIKRQMNETGKSERPADNKKVNTAVHTNRTMPATSFHTDSLNTDAEQLNNHNQKILELYSQGFSVIDISRTLELGQGEVKLVIDLYKEK